MYKVISLITFTKLNVLAMYKQHYLKYLIPFFFSFFFIYPLECSAYLFKGMSTSEGLSNRRVFAAVKDANGYIWFATREGVDRYNGEVFRHYELTSQRKRSNDRVRGIVLDRHHNVFAYTEKDVYVYNSSHECYYNVARKQLPHNISIFKLYFDIDNTLWIATSQGLYTLNKQGDIIPFISSDKIEIYTFSEGENGGFWIGTANGVSFIARSRSKQYFKLPIALATQTMANRIQSLFYDKNTKRLWLGTFSQGIYTYDVNRRKLQKLIVPFWGSPVRVISAVSNTKIWAGTDGDGVYEFDRRTLSLKRIYSESDDRNSRLGANGVYDILSDDSFIWVCTYTRGVFVYNKSKIVNQVYQHIENNTNSLNGNHVNVMLEDSDGDLWFGTNSGLSVYKSKTNTWKHFFQNNAKNHGVVLSLCETKDKKIWVGGYASELVSVDKQSGAVSTVKIERADSQSSKKRFIYSIVKDREGYIWLGGVVDKLLRFDPKSGVFKKYNIKGINKIVDYNPRQLLMASIKGVYLFDKQTGRAELLDFKNTRGYKSKHLFPFVNNVYVDKDNSSVLWIGTENDGLYKYHLGARFLQRYSTNDGLSSNSVYGILYDKIGRLWISTENGLNCFNPKTQHISSFHQIDGLVDDTFNFLSYTKRMNGDLVFGTPEGALEVTPEKFVTKQHNDFNLRFEDLMIYYKKVVADSTSSPLYHSIDSTSALELKYSQRSFAFDFVNISYFSNSNTLYSWKLEGFDEVWSAPSHSHRAVYTNIPAGKYVFKVKAIMPEQKCESAVRTIEVKVNPPFWASSFAYFIYFVLLVGVIYFVIKFYKNRLEARESDSKIRFFINMAHDIRTPLTLIKAPLAEIEGEPLSEEGRSALTLAKNNTDKLFNMVTQLLDFQKIEREAMRLHVEETQINTFVEGCVSNFYLLAKTKNLNLQMELLEQEMTCWVDRYKLTLVIENLLSNALKYTPAHGNVLLRLSVLENRLIIEIIDDGIGISAKAQHKLFTRFYRADNAVNSKETGSGIGLLLAKKMIMLHKGRISFASKEGCGTSFKIELPIDEDSYLSSEIVHCNNESQISISERHDEIDSVEQASFKILVVEDNDELRAYLSKYLRKRFKVDEAVDGQEALELIKKDAPDFIISDVLMPNVTGTELCAKLKSNIETCHIPIILLTSLSEREDIIKGFDAGADDYITKPFDMVILQSKIDAIFKNRSLFKRKYIDKTALTDESNIVSDLDKRFMAQLVELVEENITDEEFTIDTLAIEMAMSRSVFYKKMRALTDQNPKDFVRDIRMKKAANLLREKKYSIGEIAYLTGFPNAKYFSTAFKKYYGTTPSAFVDKENEELC